MTRYKNETIARLMDEGKAFHAYVDERRQIPDDPVTYRRTIAPTEGFKVCFSVYFIWRIDVRTADPVSA